MEELEFGFPEFLVVLMLTLVIIVAGKLNFYIKGKFFP